jgi:peptidoglycan/xylan/chitin deacetylase (PgdA/CDA1 family)
MNGIPVLMYHHVNKAGSFINVKPEIFDRQMRFIKDKGYETINTRDYIEIIEQKRQIPKRALMITFDDGWRDNWLYAYPILKKYGLKAVIFIITSLIAIKREPSINEENYILPDHKGCLSMIRSGHSSDVMLSWDEIRQMEDSGLIDIQSHSHTHKRWDKMYKNIDELMLHLSLELRMSKKIIEEKLNKKCFALCWPWGIHNKDYIDVAKAEGYRLCFTTEKGTNLIHTDPYSIKRIVIGNVGIFNFRKKLFIYSKPILSNFYLGFTGKK